MLLSLTKINYKTFLINLLFSFIPISFVAGNLILNVNILLFIIFAIVFYGKDIFILNFNSLDKIILIFFAYTIFTGILNNLYLQSENLNEDYTIIVKTILYLRFLIFYFVIRILINKNLIDFKSFFVFCFICTYFVCLDLIYQLNFGKDIFGHVSQDPRRLSGPFGDEFIAGSYLQRFSLFALFLFPIFFNNKNKIYLYLLLFLSLILIIVGLIIAGNRMPLILFIILITSVLSFNKSMRKFLLSFFLLSTIILTTLWNLNSNIKNHLNAFTARAGEVVEFASTVIIKNKESKYEEDKDNIIEWYRYSININGKVIPLKSTYIKEFNSGYQTWLEHKYVGGGIKSFRHNCITFNCSSHPHNYYLEILAELGLIGFFLILIVFFTVLFKSFFSQRTKEPSLTYDKIIVPFMFLFLIEIFPIKSTGSFFTTGNATYLFLIMSITIALSQTSKKKI
jgi:O-antigen ligase